MALSPKWSEEARKNVKETNIDERMLERIAKQREHLAADKEQKTQTPAPKASIPSYDRAIGKQEDTPNDTTTNGSKDDDIVSKVYSRVMVKIGAIVLSELENLAKEGRLK